MGHGRLYVYIALHHAEAYDELQMVVCCGRWARPLQRKGSHGELTEIVTDNNLCMLQFGN